MLTSSLMLVVLKLKMLTSSSVKAFNRVVGYVDVVVDVVVEVGAVKAYRACKKLLTSSLMLLIKLVLSRPTALLGTC